MKNLDIKTVLIDPTNISRNIDVRQGFGDDVFSLLDAFIVIVTAISWYSNVCSTSQFNCRYCAHAGWAVLTF